MLNILQPTCKIFWIYSTTTVFLLYSHLRKERGIVINFEFNMSWTARNGCPLGKPAQLHRCVTTNFLLYSVSICSQFGHLRECCTDAEIIFLNVGLIIYKCHSMYQHSIQYLGHPVRNTMPLNTVEQDISR